MTLTTQFYTLLAMIGMGSYFGASLDTYQYFLKRPERNKWIVFFHDILFWLLQSLLVFYVLFMVNQGEIRFYLFLALLCGFAAYQALLKKAYMSLLEIIITVCLAIFRFIYKMVKVFIMAPVLFLVHIFFVLFRFLGSMFKSIILLLMKIIGFICKIVLAPFMWIFRRIFKFLPKSVSNKLIKLYNSIEGIFGKVTNVIKKGIKKGFNKR